MTNERHVDAETRRRWGRTIKARRQELELSQEQLAQQCDVTRQHVSQIERGQRSPSDHIRVALARSLRCRVEDLFQYEQVA